MDTHKLKLLLWKNYRLRVHHSLITLMEIGLPIFIAVVLALLIARYFKKSTWAEKEFHDKHAASKNAFLTNLSSYSVHYSSSLNPTINQFMEPMAPQFKMLTPHNSSNWLEKTISERRINRSRNIIGIDFQGWTEKEYPDKLHYIVRTSDRWHTDELFPSGKKDREEHFVDKPYWKLGFSVVQLFINVEFIKKKVNPSEVPKVDADFQKLYLEAFPVPLQSNLNANLIQIFRYFVIGMVLLTSIPLLRDIIEEKNTGVKELMKTTGLREWMIWLAWYIHATVLTMIAFTVAIFILSLARSPEGWRIFDYVPYVLVWLVVMLYCLANVAFCFMFSALFHQITIACTIFIIVMILMNMATLTLEYYLHDLFVCSYPVGALVIAFSEFLVMEDKEIPFSINTFLTPQSEENSVSLLVVCIMLLFDVALYLFLTYYFTSINPGKFGVPKKPLFMLEWLLLNEVNTPPLENLDEHLDPKYFEAPPKDVPAAIQIQDLHKHYGSVYAVRGLNLNIYEGELTALLGHNGAGKTTAMSIMTGLTAPSAGNVYYNDVDVFKNMDYFRQNLGLCPQENRTFPYLTVEEHLIFFGQLKGLTRDEAYDETNEYLYMMNLDSKKDAITEELSGGMIRKLCLSIALIGKTDVLVLDEPTSGMDTESRRKMWELLLEMRGKRTVIFTTHYMEEADVLGDRIAIMNHGVVVCHGTSIFLKKAYGTGYELTITKSNDADSKPITELISSVMPSTAVEFDSPGEVVYKLPLTGTEDFPDLFRALESEQENLGIHEMGVSATTMEHVFLKAGGITNYDAKFLGAPADYNDSIVYYNQLDGWKLSIQQFKALLMKKLLYTMRNLFAVFTRIVLPTLLAIIALNGVTTAIDFAPAPLLECSLSTYANPVVVLVNNAPNIDYMGKYLPGYVHEKRGTLQQVPGPDINKALFDIGNTSFVKYKYNYAVGVEVNSSTTKVMYNLLLVHSLPIAISTWSNMVFRNYMADEANKSKVEIRTSNHPIPKKAPKDLIEGCPSLEFTQMFHVLWFFALGFCTIDLMSYFGTFVNMEHADGFYHVQMMSRVSPFIYWGSTLVFDFTFYAIIMTIRLLFFKAMDTVTLLSLGHPLDIIILLLVLFGLSELLFEYVLSYFSGSSNAEGSYIHFLLLNLACCIAVSLFFAFEKVGGADKIGGPGLALHYSFFLLTLIIPSFNFCISLLKILTIFTKNENCLNCVEQFRAACEEKYKNEGYMEFPTSQNPDGLLLQFTFLIMDIIIFLLILFLINTGSFTYWFNESKNQYLGSYSTIEFAGDEDVIAEHEKVQLLRTVGSDEGSGSYGVPSEEEESSRVSIGKMKKMLKHNKMILQDASEEVDSSYSGYPATLLVDNLRKNYNHWTTPFTVVTDVSFFVEPGTCFGLLGVNGAGKTTTFKMLTAEIIPTVGDAVIEGVELSFDKTEYLSRVGYCPQTNCFIEELTGIEMLSLIASLRGVVEDDNDALVNKWLSIIGLGEYETRPCGSYSGGNKRKLCTAMSLIGDPRVVFLDEPTSGVDPVSRRKLYDVMAQSRASGQTVVLSSHSMEECETLCNKLTIMVAGVMRCVGSTQHLKKRYAQGFSVMMKLFDVPNADFEVANLQEFVELIFGAENTVLKDQHRGLLYYQITDTSLLWSTLFEKMETIKGDFQHLIEDYVLTDTTLEEVFIAFAKREKESSVVESSEHEE